jgi:hypothetical protein
MDNMHEGPLLARRRDAARTLACSESQVIKYERQGLLKRVQLPGIRAARYASEDVTTLAKKLIDESRRRGDAA